MPRAKVSGRATPIPILAEELRADDDFDRGMVVGISDDIFRVDGIELASGSIDNVWEIAMDVVWVTRIILLDNMGLGMAFGA